jgi:hypothetical protein
VRIRVFSLAVAIALAAGTGTALAEDGTVDTPQVDSPRVGRLRAKADLS